MTRDVTQKYVRHGHPSVEELCEAQGLTFPQDPGTLRGDFWPENESLDDFLAAMREWRGHEKNDPAATI